MSNNGNNVSGGPDLDLEQSDDLPIKVVHARKAIPLSGIYDSFLKSPAENASKHWTPSKPTAEQETNSVKILANDEQSSGKGSPFRYSGTTSSAFRSIDSPFKIPATKTEKGFSATPGPWHKKQGKLVTPTKGYSSSTNNDPETPDQYNMFKTDDGWSNVRKAATGMNLTHYSSPSGGLPSSMSPLMASMVNQVVEQNSPVTSSHIRKSFNNTHTSAYMSACDGGVGVERREGEQQQLQLPTVEIDPDLDIHNVAKDLDATRFHGSLSNTRTYDHTLGSLKNPLEHLNTDIDIRRSSDNFSTAAVGNPFTIGRTLFEDSDFTNTNPKEDSYWAGNSSLLMSRHHNDSSKDPYGFASRSYPQYANYSNTDIDYSNNNSNLLGNESNEYFQSQVDTDHSFSMNRSGLSAASRVEPHFDPSYPVEHSFPAYHRRVGGAVGGGVGSMATSVRTGSHNQEAGAAVAMRNNWMGQSASDATDGVYGQQPLYPRNHTAAGDSVEDYAEVTSQLSHQFMNMQHSRTNQSCPPGLVIPSVMDTSGPVGSYPDSRHELPLGMPSSSGFNPSAPTFQPQSETGRSYGLPQNTAGGTYSAPSQQAMYDYGQSTDQAPSFRPPQQTLYEPSLPPSSGSIRGAPKHHRLSRSDGSFDPRSSGAGGERTRLHLDNSNSRLRGSGSYLPGVSSLQSSIDSETSLSSRFHPQQQPYQQQQQQVGITNKSTENILSQRYNYTSNAQNQLTVNTMPVRVSKEAGKLPFMRPDILESPRSKNAYKEFYREFRLKEKESEENAREFALKTILTAPENCKTRIYLELADICKRYNKIEEARGYYAEVCRAQPKANMGWLEWSKMEEENGNLRRALDILVLGLKVCVSNESLLTKVIKLQERLHRYEEVRGLLGKLRYESIEKVWKSVLEGSLFEARTGNIRISRKLFKYLMHLVPWYGPIYSEAYQLEEKEYNDAGALEIIQKGLKELPRYGPLWFGLFRIMERQDVKEECHHWQRGVKPQLENMKRETNNAVRSISKELTWKVHMECSQAEERSAEIAALGMHHASGLSYTYCLNVVLEDARKSLVRSLLSCPANLRWRVFLSGARLELSVGEVDKARDLLQRSLREVPPKSKVYVYLECSRVEEYLGNLDMVRLLLVKARQEFSREWKVYLEAVLVEARAGMMEKATKLAREALRYHSGSGRLWALYIHLCHRLEMKYFNITEKSMIEQRLGLIPTATEPIDCDKMWLSKERVIRRAIAEVPKSGEVWCERGRCQLNPLSVHCFDLSLAQQSLSFATQFTPQYGDTFIEYVRLEMLCQVLLPRVLMALQVPVLPFLRQYLSEDPESDLVELLRSQWGSEEFGSESSKAPTLTEADRCRRRQTILAIERMRYNAGDLIQQYRDVSIKNLNRRCVNADPNYGTTWFHCRGQPYDIPTTVLYSALDRLIHELTDTQKIYTRAILHFVRRCLRPSYTPPGSEVLSGGSSPVRSTSAPAGRNRADKGEVTRSLNLPAGALSQHTISATAAAAQGTAINTTASLNGSVPVPLGLTMLGGRKSPMRPNSQQQGDAGLKETTAAELGEQELWTDMTLVGEELTAAQGFDTVQLLPFVEIDSGAVYCSADFVTGMIEMNRIVFDSNLSNDIRRKLLFGSDHVVS